MAEQEWKVEPFRPSGEDELPRKLYRKEDLGLGSLFGNQASEKVEEVCSARDKETAARLILGGKPPNLIGSKTGTIPTPWNWKKHTVTHAPVIDLDIPCRLVPSATPNHYHLYIDREIPEKAYEKLLDALVEAGLVQRGFANQFDQYGQTFVRWGCLKGDANG